MDDIETSPKLEAFASDMKDLEIPERLAAIGDTLSQVAERAFTLAEMRKTGGSILILTDRIDGGLHTSTHVGGNLDDDWTITTLHRLLDKFLEPHGKQADIVDKQRARPIQARPDRKRGQRRR